MIAPPRPANSAVRRGPLPSDMGLMVEAAESMVGQAANEAEAAFADVRRGQFAVVVSTVPGRPEQGYLTLAAAEVDAEAINFMLQHGGGLIYLALPEERCKALRIAPMQGAYSSGKDDVMVTIEARTGVTTGISAADRARTISVGGDPASESEDLVSPGHVVPLRARGGGVLGHQGRAEAATELMRLAGLPPAAALSEILDEAGGVLDSAELGGYARRHGLRIVRADELAHYRRRGKADTRHAGRFDLATAHGSFEAVAFRFEAGAEHFALLAGDLKEEGQLPVWVHRGCLGGNVFGSRECDCAANLDRDLRALAEHGSGALIYLAASRRCPEPDADDGGSAAATEARSLAIRIADALGIENPAFEGGERS